MLQNEGIRFEWDELTKNYAELLMKEIESKSITIGDKTMKFQYFLHGDKPEGGYSLVFGLHGGGGCPSEVNEQQFHNHLHLYDKYLPSGVIWFVPRSCEEASDMWWKSYLQDFFRAIIRGFVLKDIVNPNKIFITGYSAGGDGIYHLGPMIADWLAGAAMMAGHPNNVELYNVRNISFSIQVGGKDAAYNRNEQARKYIETMKELGQQHGGFKADYNCIHEHCAHWMNHSDGEIFANFLNEIRNPYPDYILFKQHPRTKKQYFYYIEIEAHDHKQLIVVRKIDNVFYIESQPIKVSIYVNHLMVDFSKEVVVYHNDKVTVSRLPKANWSTIEKSISERQDPCFIFEDEFVSDPTSSKKGKPNLREEVQQPKELSWF